MSVELLTYLLSGALFMVCVLSGIVWNNIIKDIKSHGDDLNLKVNQIEFDKIEKKWQKDLDDVKADNEKLYDKLEKRYDKEIEAVADRLEKQVKSSEENILKQMHLIFDRTK